MSLILNRLANWLKANKGQGLVEYALLICLIVIVVGGAVLLFGQYIASLYAWFIVVIRGWCGC